MSEYWLISAPGDKTCQQTFDTMNNLTNKQNNLCNNYKFHIPDLKVGTLDQLVGLSDDLGKLDTYVEQITRKVAAYLGEVLEDQRDKLHENLLANNSPGPPPPPQPPDDVITMSHAQQQHQQHSVLTGKISNLSNSRDTTTTTCSACHSGGGSGGSGGSGTGAGLHHCSSTEGSERDFDLLLSSPICNCDECAAIGMTGSSSTASVSAVTATTLNIDEQQQQHHPYHHHPHPIHQQQQQQLQQQHQYNTSSTLMCAAAGKATSIACAITGNAFGTANSSASSYYLAGNASSTLSFCSTSAPTDSLVGKCSSGSSNNSNSSSHFGARQRGASQHFFPSNLTTASSHQHYAPTATATTTPLSATIDSLHHNNNTCSHNNNNRYFLQHHHQQQQQQQQYTQPQYHHHHHHQQQQQQQQQHHTHHHQHHQPRQNPQLQQLQLHDSGGSGSGCGYVGGSGGGGVDGRGGNDERNIGGRLMSDGGGSGGAGAGAGDSAGTGTGDELKNSNSTSDLSDTFDWWFHRHKRNSKKSRSSPVSSCCGSSSQGRSSPDTDLAEPPAFPLSPADLSVYITRFQWDMAKYPIKQSLRNIADIISKQIGQIDADLKTKSNAYNNLKGSLQNLEKKQTGSLLTRNLADLVKKEHFILDSEYLTTLLVIVPKMMANDWLANYEKITDMIVPRSSTMITQDQDFCLFNVTLFKKVVEEFKLHAREKKFIVRDFVYNEEELAAGKNEITKLITDKKKQFGPLVRWLKVNFSEAFCALVHVKALRVFVESVLRYGLPVNFQAILIEPNKKSMKRLRECLNQLYGHLDGASAAGQSTGADNVDIPGLGFGQSEYYPYVFYKINIDMVEQQKI